MNCPNCRSEILEGWLYCPKCGRPSSSAVRPTGAPSGPPPSISQWELLDSLGFGLLFVTPRRRIGQMNAVARAIFGVNKNKDPLGKPFEEIIQHPDCLTILRRNLQEGNLTTPEAGDSKEPDEFSIEDAQGQEQYYRVSHSHIHDTTNALAGTAFVLQDVTGLRTIERWKYGVISLESHEISGYNVITKGFIQTLLEDEMEQQYDRNIRREFYTIIDRNANRLSRRIADIHYFRRIQWMGVAGVEMVWEDSVSLRKVTEEVLAQQHARTDKHTFILDFEPEEIEFESDPDKLHCILYNCIWNALRYSPDAVEIRILARLQPADEEFPQGSVRIGVHDPGEGIYDWHRQRPGQPDAGSRPAFVELSAGDVSRSIVKTVISAHKGTMKVATAEDNSSTFWMRLPLRQPNTEKSELV